MSILKHSVSTDTINYHTIISSDEYNDEYDKELEQNPDRLMKSETA